MKFYNILAFQIGILFLLSCNTENNNATKPDETTITKLFVENQYESNILPAFSDLKTSTDNLVIQIKNFITNPNQTNLDAAQLAYENAAIACQYIKPFNFGPSEDGITALKENINTYPVNSNSIENYILANDTSFNNFKRETRGLGTIDYLLHTITGTDVAVLANYGSGSDFRKNYLMAVANKIKRQVDATNTGWIAYKSTFTTDFSTNASSSTTKLFNSMLIAYEEIKNYKLALPLGLRAGQTKSEPMQVEAYYSGISLKLIEHNLKAIENVWQCKSKTGIKGKGFDDKLIAANKADLVSKTQNQFKEIYATLTNVESERLSKLISEDSKNTTNLLSSISSMTRFIKSDLSSALGLTITYSSNDGD